MTTWNRGEDRPMLGDDLIDRIRAHAAHPDDDELGVAANDLLHELFSGYPVENLARLLHAGDDTCVRTGTWLLSELGERAAPMTGELPALLAHPLRYVRFYALDVVLVNGRHGDVLAPALKLAQDPEAAVRWKALSFLAGASQDQLAAGASRLEDGRVRDLTEWLAGGPAPRDVVARLGDPDLATRLFAAAAAARLAAEDTGPLEAAAGAEDREISSFASERLGSPR
ncbi:hypothetical protein ACIBI9_28270 [Nonomuraea sp. NPDC050451]|uniref:hypothetical protein n=1 Tax=Nonomuraea sp. NPDC050451 TaxID=3364364 RepID=UPI00379433FF